MQRINENYLKKLKEIVVAIPADEESVEVVATLLEAVVVLEADAVVVVVPPPVNVFSTCRVNNTKTTMPLC